MVQGIRLCTPNSGGPSLIPGQGTRFHILHSQVNIVRVVCNILKKMHTTWFLLCGCWLCEGVMRSFRCFCVLCIWPYVLHSVVSDSLWPPWITACQAPLSIGILQAGILKWVAMLCSRVSSQARDQTRNSHVAGRFFTIWATREAHIWLYCFCNQMIVKKMHDGEYPVPPSRFCPTARCMVVAEVLSLLLLPEPWATLPSARGSPTGGDSTSYPKLW